jgi:phosphoesterase RecJ-like protein
VKGKRIINIDHHESGKGFGDLKLINPHASSTAEILYQLLSESDRPILKDTATCLYAAISNDTGSFQFRNTSRAALETAACLVKLGANAAEIARGLYESHPKSRILLLAMVFQTIVFSHDSKRADITLTTEMFKNSGATVPMTEGFVNFLTAVQGVEVAILFRQMGPAKFKISLRSQGAINVARLCEKFGGGGHAQAAGANLEGELAAVQELIRKEVDELIAKNDK